MLDNLLIEFFTRNFGFVSKYAAKKQKYEYDYMSLNNNTVTIPGSVNVSKMDYIRIISNEDEFQGIVTAVEFKKNETKIQYKSLLSLIDVDVYKDRNQLKGMSVEGFVGTLISETYRDNEDEEQNIPGIEISTTSETLNGTLNLKDDIHNIYDVAISAFRKYEIILSIKLDIMNKKLLVEIGKNESKEKVIEGDLKNILDVNITIKDDSESVNKAVIVGTYAEDHELYGDKIIRTYYLDKESGEITQSPAARALPVVFCYKNIEVKDETFEDDAYQEAYDLIYQEKYDNEIKIKVSHNDSLYKVREFQLGQTCKIIKDGTIYTTVYTGYCVDGFITLIFGTIRTEYTKKIRRM